MFQLKLKVLGEVVWVSRRREMLKLGSDVNIATFHTNSLSRLQFWEKIVKRCYIWGFVHVQHV